MTDQGLHVASHCRIRIRGPIARFVGFTKATEVDGDRARPCGKEPRDQAGPALRPEDPA